MKVAGGGRSLPRTGLSPEFRGDGNLAANYLNLLLIAPVRLELIDGFTGVTTDFPTNTARISFPPLQ
jgi:hypothetical protein